MDRVRGVSCDLFGLDDAMGNGMIMIFVNVMLMMLVLHDCFTGCVVDLLILLIDHAWSCAARACWYDVRRNAGYIP